jgi:hypothetical protein
VAKAHRSTRNDHLYRNARLGSRRSAAMTLGISPSLRPVLRARAERGPGDPEDEGRRPMAAWIAASPFRLLAMTVMRDPDKSYGISETRLQAMLL